MSLIATSRDQTSASAEPRTITWPDLSLASVDSLWFSSKIRELAWAKHTKNNIIVGLDFELTGALDLPGQRRMLLPDFPAMLIDDREPSAALRAQILKPEN